MACGFETFSQGPVVVFQWRNAPGWPVQAVSPSAEGVFGRPAAQLQEAGPPYADLVHEDDRERFAAAAARLGDDGGQRIGPVEHRIRRPDGRVRWLKAFAELQRNDAGVAERIAGYVVDISSRKAAEDELKDVGMRLEQVVAERTARLQALIENGFNGVAVVDDEGVVTGWNERAEELFGWAAQEAVGRDLTELVVPPEHRQALWQAVQRYLATGDAPFLHRRLELTAMHRDGHRIPVDVIVSAVPAGGGHDFLAVARDVSERRQYQAALERDYHIRHAISEILRIALEPGALEGHLQRILEFVLELPWFESQGKGAIFLADPERDRLLMQASQNLDAQVRETCREVEYGDCICGAAAARSDSVFWADGESGDGSVLNHEVARHGHYCVPIRSGERLLGVFNVYLPPGHAWDEHEQEFMEAVAATVGGVIERKRAEEEQLALNRRLQDAHNQLLQSEKMASIGQLAAGVAHEINNPIGYVGSNLVSLREYVDDLLRLLEAYREAAEGESGALERARAVEREVELAFLRQDLSDLLNESGEGLDRVKQIIQDLKDFSRADRSEEWAEADLREGLDSTLNIVWNELKYKAEVEKAYGELPPVKCLPSQLNQVFMNLLVNAGQAIQERGTITLRTGQTEPGWVYVEVADTGGGIPEAERARIFDPFYTTKPVGKGTGLGLSLAYSIVDKHHGRIEVVSEAGVGTTFRIHLPVDPDTGT